MKKNIKLLITSLFLFFIQFSCEKDKNYVEIASIQLDSSLIIEKAKEHFIASTRGFRADDEKKYTPKWEFSEVITKQNGNNLVLTPLYGDKMVSYTNKPGYFRRLVTELDKKNAIKKTEIIELFGEINFIKSNYKILLDDSNNKRLKEFKGGILVTDYYNKNESGKKYDSEKIIGKLNVNSKSKNKNTRAFSEDCWGMFLTTTYEDGSQTEELLYWWCNNSGNQTNNQDQQGPDHGSSGGDDENAPKPIWANESQLKNKLCVNSNSAFHQIKTQMINDWRDELNNSGIYDSNPDIGYDSKTNHLMFKSVSNPSKSYTAPINFSAYDNCP